MKTFRFFEKRSLRTKLILTYSTLFALSMLIGNTWIFQNVSNDILIEIEKDLELRTTQTVNTIQAAADNSVKNYLQIISDTNLEITTYFYDLYQTGVIDESFAQKRAEEILLSQKIGDTGYTYVTNSDGQIIIHPVSESIGQNISGYEIPPTQKITKEAYLEYEWQNSKKVLCITYFEPWDWIIITSSSRNEFHKLINIEDFENKVRDLKFGETGYTFILSEDGEFIVHPQYEGMTVNELDNAKNRDVINQIIKQKIGLLTYVWKEPGETNTQKKLAVLNYLPEYRWIVASSSYRDEFYTPLDHLRIQMAEIFIFTILAVIIMTVALSRYITKPLELVVSAFEAGSRGELNRQLMENRTDEIGILAKHYNQFIESLEKKQTEFITEMNERISKEKKLKTLLDTTKEGFIQIDLDLIIVDANPSMASMLGYELHEIISHHLTQFLDAKNWDILKNHLDEKKFKSLKSGYEIDFTRKDLSILSCLMSASPILNEKEQIVGFFGMLTDISELQENIAAKEKALNDLQELNQKLELIIDHRTKELRESLETLKNTQRHLVETEKLLSLGKLISGIAHEINTPLGNCITATTYIKAETETMDKKYHEGQMHRLDFENFIEMLNEAFQLLTNNLGKASDLITTFKKVSLESKKGGKRQVQVKELIDDVVALFKGKIEKEGHSIIIESDPNITLYSYPYAITQMMTPLISNAIIHGFNNRHNGSIKITVLDQGESVRFNIKDNGHGIPKDHLDHVFDPFYTLKSSTEGVGLGLHIVYNTVVNTLKGTIRCQSTHKEGTTFEITLPKSI